jgi:uncharacterized membrane protein YcaP (DUF421 family)
VETLEKLIGPDDGTAEWWQLSIRAAVLFVLGLILLRIAGRRTFSKATPLDIIVALILGSNLSRMMTGRAQFLEGLAATLTLVLIHRVVAMAALRWKGLARLTKSSPAVLVRDGEPDEDALFRHGISRADLLEALRLEQVDDVGKVKTATLEASGRISVVRRDEA